MLSLEIMRHIRLLNFGKGTLTVPVTIAVIHYDISPIQQIYLFHYTTKKIFVNT